MSLINEAVAKDVCEVITNKLSINPSVQFDPDRIVVSLESGLGLTDSDNILGIIDNSLLRVHGKDVFFNYKRISKNTVIFYNFD